MADSKLAKKLFLRENHKIATINVPRDYGKILGDLPKAMKAVKYDGLLWIAYPKQTSKVETDLNRDILWKLMLKKDFRAVSRVALDEIWSVMRFRPVEKVGK